MTAADRELVVAVRVRLALVAPLTTRREDAIAEIAALCDLVERLDGERDEARVACELALRAAAASLVCSTCMGRHGAPLVEEAIRLVTWAAPEVVEPLQAAAQARRADLVRQRDEALARAAEAGAREAKLREALDALLDVWGAHSHIDDCDRKPCTEHEAWRLVEAALAPPAGRAHREVEETP